MRTRFFALFCAALMLVSLFLPWFEVPYGQSFVPFDALRQLDAKQIDMVVKNLPPEGMAFFGSFALAALMLLLGLMGSTPRFLALATGALPVGLVVWALLSGANQAGASGLNIPARDLVEFLKQAAEFIGVGAWAWIGSGTSLLILGLVDPGQRRA
jgi:hypothetical protein